MQNRRLEDADDRPSNIYILPKGSPWREWTDTHPLDKLAESLAVAAQRDVPLFLLGDLNGRTASERALPHHPIRVSVDTITTSQGNRILDMARDFNVIILNGIQDLGPRSGERTSLQGSDSSSCTSVIDYAMCSQPSLDLVDSLTIGKRVRGVSDHATVILAVWLPLHVEEPPTNSRTTPHSRPQFCFPTETVLDRLYRDLIKTKISAEDKLVYTFGAVRSGGNPQHVYTSGSCTNTGKASARAGAGVYWAPQCSKNIAARVPDGQTNNRGECFAIMLALANTSLSRPLQIYSSSEYAIRLVTHWAPKNASLGWRCINGDILRVSIQWIKARSAVTHFEHISPHPNNPSRDEAGRLAKMGAAMAAGDPYEHVHPPADLTPAAGPLLNVPKVSTNLPPTPRSKTRPAPPFSPASEAHRGRALERHTTETDVKSLLDATHSPHAFWEAYRKLSGPKPKPVVVSLEGLASVFKMRMNPPPIPPADFNLTRRETMKIKAAQPRLIMPMVPPEDGFSRPWSVKDIEWAKSHIDSHPGKSSSGLDRVKYDGLLEIENERLVELFNMCMSSDDAPSAWLSTVIAAIPKKGLPLNDPASYRTIGLESCALKMLTLLIHKRMYDWAEDHKIFPPSQNGFRAHYRTNNNAFILRCLIDRARANGEVLYTAFVDISNAFPSTDHDALWVRLYEHGMTGSIITWLRTLYGRMEYAVRLEGNMSESFRSLVGVLIGDPASPTLWNLYLADFHLQVSDGDALLGGMAVAHLEHADDMVIISRTAAGLQAHLNSLHAWCGDNFLVVNALKTWIMLFGPIPTYPPRFSLGSTPVHYRASHTYVGITFCTNEYNIFANHYKEKASKARQAAHSIIGVERITKTLPPAVGRRLYTAMVDPHLTGGCEVALDIDARAKQLFDVQKYFLRRLLRLNERSMIAPLFTELNLFPLSYRRVALALRYLGYIISLPPTHLANLALRDSFDLLAKGKPGWAADLAHTLRGMHTPIILPTLESMTRERGAVDMLIRGLNASVKAWLINEVDSSSRLYLLHGRLEPMEEGPPLAVVLYLRHYLGVADARYRKALTRLILSDHPLALEQWRHAERGRPAVPRDRRLCRFCASETESPEHALMVCVAWPELAILRMDFIIDIRLIDTVYPRLYNTQSALGWLRKLITDPRVVTLLAKYTYDVFAVFEARPHPRPGTTVPRP